MPLVYNGIQYEIENEGEIEKMETNLVAEDDGDFESDDQFQESAWEPENVHLFLDECIKRKTEIINPKVRRRKVFSDIRDIMKGKGYVFRIESLDRKLRNMKIHYLVSRENNKKSLKRVHWPYYDKMKIIYPDEPTHVRKRPAPQQQQTFERDFPSSSPPPTAAEYVTLHSSPSTSPPPQKIFKSSQTPQCTYNSPDDEVPVHSNVSDHPNKLEAIRQQILSFEERRTVAAEKILNELKQSNLLKRKLLEINMLMFKAERELEE